MLTEADPLVTHLSFLSHHDEGGLTFSSRYSHCVHRASHQGNFLCVSELTKISFQHLCTEGDFSPMWSPFADQEEALGEAFLQPLHWQGLPQVWTRWCCRRWDLRLKAFPHRPHL